MTNTQKIFVAIVGLIILLLILLFTGIIPGLRETNPPKVELEFWSVFDDSEVYEPIIAAFMEENPGVTINYRKKSIATYEKDLLDALVIGRGPDIFSINNAWLWQYYNKIYPLPEVFSDKTKGMNIREYRSAFMDVAASDFTSGETIFAIPFSVDTLALYYNRSIFNSETIVSPPETWEEFADIARRLAKYDDQGNITRAGASVGTMRNINRPTDIVSLIMLQKEVSLTDKDAKALFEPKDKAAEALRFYTDFAKRGGNNYIWNDQMPYSIDAFIEGKSAMMIGYAYHIQTIYAKAPHLNFKVAEIPQFKDSGIKINYANYWGQTVSSMSRNPDTAWKFILYAASADGIKFYSDAAKRPVSRKDLIGWQNNKNELFGVFVKSALSAVSWSQFDSKTNERILSDMINDVVTGRKDAMSAISDAVRRINSTTR